jgi:rare lipoprotein A (peptidoglycan hydrolase)
LLGRNLPRLVVAFMSLTLFACAQQNVPRSDALPVVTNELTAAVAPAGPTEVGKASVYSNRLQGRRMANGERYRPNSNVAASKTLPIGTVATVTNLDNLRWTVVRVADRGPFRRGRIVDLASQAASELGLTNEQGVARVVIIPVKAPSSTGGAD